MDFIILGAVLLFSLIGLIKGGAKMFFGLFMLLIIMVACSFIASAICPLLLKSEKDDGPVTYSGAAKVLMAPFENVLPKGDDLGTLLDTEVVKGEDGNLYIGETPLKTTVTEKVPYVGSFAASFVNKAAHPGETLRTTFAYHLTLYVYETAMWVMLVVALAIVRNIYRKKLFVYLDNNSGPSKVDRLIGVGFNIIILLILLWGVGVLIANYDDGDNWAHSADSFLTNGVIAKPLMANNPLLKIIPVKLPVEGSAA